MLFDLETPTRTLVHRRDPCAAQIIDTEFLAEHCEGVRHLGLVTDDIDAIFCKFEQRELKPKLVDPIVGETLSRFTYFDTEPRVGHILEFLEVPSIF